MNTSFHPKQNTPQSSSQSAELLTFSAKMQDSNPNRLNEKQISLNWEIREFHPKVINARAQKHITLGR
jgi:hypothetical protein